MDSNLREKIAHPFHSFFLLFVLGGLLLSGLAPAASAQKKKNTPPPADTTPVVQGSDQQQVDFVISEMLAAWQIQDIDRLHKDYADDVIIVNGQWAPPIIGWNNFLTIYQQQRGRLQQVTLNRYNTFSKVAENFAWACYQWELSGLLDGQPSASHGQTTLIFEKRNGHWVIVHNHTSFTADQMNQQQPLVPSQAPKH